MTFSTPLPWHVLRVNWINYKKFVFCLNGNLVFSLTNACSLDECSTCIFVRQYEVWFATCHRKVCSANTFDAGERFWVLSVCLFA
jgi:hypothetical protein